MRQIVAGKVSNYQKKVHIILFILLPMHEWVRQFATFRFLAISDTFPQ